MRATVGQRLRAYVAELTSALPLAFTTAAATLMLAVVLSVVLGGENVRHREANRCQAALIVAMLRDAYAVNPAYEAIRDRYPEVNLEGIDCTPYVIEPLEPNAP